MSAYLTYEERLEIEAGLKEHKTFGEIGRQIEKDRTTVAKEIKRNAVEKKTGTSVYSCRLCSHCNTSCTDFKEEICTVLNKAPYVCNGCLEQDKCTLRKRVYLASDALNLAACYSCTLIPETSCEEFNVFLDRGLIVGTYDKSLMGAYSGYIRKIMEEKV